MDKQLEAGKRDCPLAEKFGGRAGGGCRQEGEKHRPSPHLP